MVIVWFEVLKMGKTFGLDWGLTIAQFTDDQFEMTCLNSLNGLIY